ncbi:MAG: SigB/SigF/SigG family RNA polymerase sigma factor [Clostridia bacterium]|nr:SigB/SigF/SigG family RNA polymerase sigma factor [Clostridia bacterium]
MLYENNVETILSAQKGDEQAKEKLLNDNFPLIKSVIRRYKDRGLEYDDLYQLGCMGFVKAINNFKPEFNVKFSTYAVPMIAGEVKRFLRDDGVIKVSRSIKMQARQISQYIDSVRNQNGESPTMEQIADHFELEPADVVLIMESVRMPISICTPIEDEDSNSAEMGDFLLSTGNEEESYANKIFIKEILSKLTPREQKIIKMRYFMDKTQSEIAEILGVSQVQVSRIENKIISNIRKNMAK